MDDFINVFKRDPKLQITKRNILDKCNNLPLNCQSKIGYDSLIQNVILKKMINLMITIIVDIDIELKMKISRLKYHENKNSYMKHKGI